MIQSDPPPPQVKVLLVHPAPQLKVQLCQMALPTPVATPAPAVSQAPHKNRSTPSSPVPWRAPSPQTTFTPDDTVMEWPTKLALAKVHIISSCTCWCMCVWMAHAFYRTGKRVYCKAALMLSILSMDSILQIGVRVWPWMFTDTNNETLMLNIWADSEFNQIINQPSYSFILCKLDSCIKTDG